jgi:cytidylate kinase
MIVTIDGPAGAGKSSAARLLAERLGFHFLDTGAMYRAVTLAGLRARCDLTSQAALAQLLDTVQLDMTPTQVLLNGEDVSAAIRTPEVTAASGAVASSPAVRNKLVEWQRNIAAGRNTVCEGRDQGTIAFPQAECKFFLVADPVERARRRHEELTARGVSTTLEEILKAQEERDARDAARDIAPMAPAADAIQLDSTKLTLEQVVQRMEQEVRARQASQRQDSPPILRVKTVPATTRSDALARTESTWFRLWHEFLYLPYHTLFTLGFSVRLQGKRNMPWTGPALVIANHQSFLDPLLVGLVARRPLVYLARKTLFRNRWFAAMIRSLNAVPIDQEGIGLDGVRTVLEQLKLGKAVVMFPEGARTEDVPIVPVGIAGAYDAWPIWRPYPIPAPLFLPPAPGTISVSLGQPFDSAPFAKMPRKEALEELFDKIRAEQVRAEKLRRR